MSPFVIALKPGSASFDVASGRIIASTVGDTRTEADYLAQSQQTLATALEVTKLHFVMDFEYSSIRIVSSLCRSTPRHQ